MARLIAFIKPLLPHLLLLALAGGLVIGCQCSYDPHPTTPPGPPPPATVVLTKVSGWGEVMTDTLGHVLYFDTRDVTSRQRWWTASTYLPNWWPFTPTVFQSGTGLYSVYGYANADGQSVAHYRGWPLYTYRPGSATGPSSEYPGQVGGDGIDFHCVAKPYSVMVARLDTLDANTRQQITLTYLTNARGVALYTFEPDSAKAAQGDSLCQGACLDKWSACVITDSVVIPSKIPVSLVSRMPNYPGSPYNVVLAYRKRRLYLPSSQYAKRGVIMPPLTTAYGTWRLAQL